MSSSNCVCETRDGRAYYPPTIPKPRKKEAFLYDFVPMACITAVAISLAPNSLNFILVLSSTLSAISLSELLNRLKLFIQEKQHVQSRYEGSIKNLVTDVFTLTPPILFLLSSSCCYYLIHITSFSESNCSLSTLFLTVLVAWDLQRILRLEKSSLNDSLQIGGLNGMDYGSGMAHSYFHGYLKIVLPRYGENGRSIRDLISIYEAREKVSFSVKKLFILMPLSANCPETLGNPDLGIEESSSLLEKVITVAGVKDRVYKNAVYKLLQDDTMEKVYVSMEYATPLKTFYDVLQSSESYRKHRNEIVSNFYRTLRGILRAHPEINDLCELIYYDDKLPNGEYRKDIKDIVLGRIREIQRN